MTNEEVRGLLKSSKCYVDFGNHPGKDRFPREAAICGCMVVTGKRGSAAYAEDVCIPEEYKFDEKSVKIKDIADSIKKFLAEYNTRIDDFESYRQYILGEKTEFSKCVKEIFL